MICRSHGIHSLSTIRPDVHRNLLDMIMIIIMMVIMMMMMMMEMMIINLIIIMSKVIPSPCQFTTYSIFESRQVVPQPSHFRSLYDDRYRDGGDGR